MAVRRLVLILAFTLANFTAHAAAAAKDPLALIQAIYKSYAKDSPTPSLTDDFYSRRMQRLLEADRKTTPQGEAGTIDWDVFIDGNDWALTEMKIALVSRSDAKAQVRATFRNHKEPRDMLFDLVRERGRWVIDEVRATKKGGRWTMSKILTHAPDAFPDEKLTKPGSTGGKN